MGVPLSSSFLSFVSTSAVVTSCFFVLCCCCFTHSLVTSRKSASVLPNSAQCRCSADETFAPGLSSGQFKTPGFPMRYCNNLNCRWTIMPAEQSFVGAVLDFFETEHRFDVLEVYQTWWNGTSLLSAKQAVLFGSFDARTMERQFFSSIGGGLKFRFLSDNTDSDYHGFKISFRRYPKGDRANSPCPVPFHHATSAIQTLPPISPSFHFDSSCIFVIDSTDANAAVNLTITQFRAHTMMSIKIFESENFQVHFLPRKPLAKIEPGLSPILPITTISRTNTLTILLSTVRTPFVDRSAMLSDSGSAIYELQFSETQSLCACPPSQLVVSRVRPASVSSPGWPDEYCDSANCTTAVALEGPVQKSAGGGPVEGLRARINQFQTEPDQDYVAVWAEDSSRHKMVLSNQAMEMRHLTFDGPQFVFSFITDHSIVDMGFNFSVEAYRKERECVCPTLPNTLLEGRAHYEENSFSRQKCQFMDCVWYINAPKSLTSSTGNLDAYHRIVLKINHTIDGELDFVLVAQGEPTERNPFKRKLNSLSADVEVTMEFEGTLPITLWFHREAVDDEDGEQRQQQKTPENGEAAAMVLLNFSYEWRDVCLCGADEFEANADSWRPLRSPDFPHNYCRNMRCQWILIAPEGYHLVLNITFFSTEADQDFLYIFEGNDTTRKHKEMLTGPHYGSTVVHSEQRVLALLFVSDGSIQADGFELWYRAEANNDAASESTMNGGGYFPKMLVFFLFLILALTGAVFLFTRSQRIGGAAAAFDDFVSNNSFPEWAARLFFRRRPNPSSHGTASFTNFSSSFSNPFLRE